MVAVVLAILAALVVPRFGSVRRTEDRLAVDQIADLMRMWAYRNSVMTQQVGIWRNGETGILTLMIRDLDPDHPDEAPIWQHDRLSNEVRLPDTSTIIEVLIDGERQDVGNWFVQSNADGSRPRFEVAINGAIGESRLILEPFSSSVQRIAPDGTTGARAPIDLDREIGERTPW